MNTQIARQRVRQIGKYAENTVLLSVVTDNRLNITGIQGTHYSPVQAIWMASHANSQDLSFKKESGGHRFLFNIAYICHCVRKKISSSWRRVVPT